MNYSCFFDWSTIEKGFSTHIQITLHNHLLYHGLVKHYLIKRLRWMASRKWICFLRINPFKSVIVQNSVGILLLSSLGNQERDDQSLSLIQYGHNALDSSGNYPIVVSYHHTKNLLLQTLTTSQLSPYGFITMSFFKWFIPSLWSFPTPNFIMKTILPSLFKLIEMPTLKRIIERQGLNMCGEGGNEVSCYISWNIYGYFASNDILHISKVIIG